MILAVANTFGQSDGVSFLSRSHAMIRVQQGERYILLPIEEKADMSNIRVLTNDELIQDIHVRLAVDNIDYYVPFDLSHYQGKKVIFDVYNTGNVRSEGTLSGFVCWNTLKYADVLDSANRERFRPSYHHTPLWGWMNDPNGMFYKDGEWHLFFQHNPYGSQWENMNWGHSVSTDLIHWTQLPEAIEPDGLGTIFSGSCVVDSANTAGFGKGAVIAFYTSNGENQVQSMAYSTDNGRTFTKYPGNPIITSDVPDFRDPHVFWNQEAGIWNMILAAGQEMRIYSSKNLKDWMYESSFGQGYGSHAGVWECPDLMELPVRGTNKHKWMLICNINPGGPSGGSATQYFVGQFDGHKFTCESKPEVTKWLDYGKDHYATVTFSNAPDGRHVAMAWMSNWQYGNQVPTKQYRSANSIPCDLGLYEYDGETYASVTPSRELFNLRGKVISRPSSSCEILATLKGSCTFTLDNDKGEYVRLAYDAKAKTFSMDRRKSGDTSFSELFPVKTTAPVNGKINRLRVFIDHSSVEAFDADGKMSMTNLVFPSVPYNKLSVKGKVKITIYSLNK
jgi:levanase/fructan beta-fructosidase